MDAYLAKFLQDQVKIARKQEIPNETIIVKSTEILKFAVSRESEGGWIISDFYIGELVKDLFLSKEDNLSPLISKVIVVDKPQSGLGIVICYLSKDCKYHFGAVARNDKILQKLKYTVFLLRRIMACYQMRRGKSVFHCPTHSSLNFEKMYSNSEKGILKFLDIEFLTSLATQLTGNFDGDKFELTPPTGPQLELNLIVREKEIDLSSISVINQQNRNPHFFQLFKDLMLSSDQPKYRVNDFIFKRGKSNPELHFYQPPDQILNFPGCTQMENVKLNFSYFCAVSASLFVKRQRVVSKIIEELAFLQQQNSILNNLLFTERRNRDILIAELKNNDKIKEEGARKKAAKRRRYKTNRSLKHQQDYLVHRLKATNRQDQKINKELGLAARRLLENEKIKEARGLFPAVNSVAQEALNDLENWSPGEAFNAAK